VHGSRALPVEVRDVHHDWLDWLAAVAGIAGVVGAIVAVVALVIATRAAADAKVQREAAEAQTRYLERRADPVIQVHASEPRRPADPSHRWVVLTLGLRNEGDRAVEHLPINFLIPDVLTWRRVDQFGHDSDEGAIAHTPERLGDHEGARYWDIDVGRLVPHGGMNRVLYVQLMTPPPGSYVLKAALMHDDLPKGVRERYWRLTIPEPGVPLGDVEPFEPDA